MAEHHISDEDRLKRMNPEAKAKWLAALRSGEYTRATGALKNRDGYCCLGVLCEALSVEFENSALFLPRKAVKLSGLSQGSQSLLANLNDGCSDDVTPRGYEDCVGISFNSLADFIEEKL